MISFDYWIIFIFFKFLVCVLDNGVFLLIDEVVVIVNIKRNLWIFVFNLLNYVVII